MATEKTSEYARGKLTDKIVRALEPPAAGNRIKYDAELAGFGIRVTAAGAKAFVLNYTVAGRERRMTIGAYPTWSVDAARKEARRLRQKIDGGSDPLEERESARAAETVNELCGRYLAEYAPKKRTAKSDQALIERTIRPRLGNRKVAAISYSDIDRMHREVTNRGTPYMANRLLALLSKMFALAIRWGMRADNPAKGIERNTEEPRRRYLSGDEMRRLTEALGAHANQSAANAVRLLLLTGARRGEVLGATWNQFDLETGVWTKPAASTKTKREHKIPLSDAARQLLTEMKAAADNRAKETTRLPSRYVFPTRVGTGSITGIKVSWAAVCKAADLQGVRLHDLRHTYASVLASAGLSLPIIGALLGHTQAATTQRYSHLFDDPLRAATEQVAAAVMGSKTGKSDTGEVVPIGRSRQ